MLTGRDICQKPVFEKGLKKRVKKGKNKKKKKKLERVRIWFQNRKKKVNTLI